jgi:hypothetical protein
MSAAILSPVEAFSSPIAPALRRFLEFKRAAGMTTAPKRKRFGGSTGF